MTTFAPPPNAFFLMPAELLILSEPALVSTILGSCVAVTFFHKRTGLAAICHALLPSSTTEDCFKFVNCALAHMLDQFESRKILRREIEVKVFGGADVLATSGGFSGGTVGTKNIRAAFDFIKGAGLRVASSDTGGKQGRKILFHSHTGEVWLKRLGQGGRS
ncbi:chemotaxis protein CheD [Desulfuromonas sp. AOP6]|uniref:chemotaxis protein CheD n=1 Tax=Desulfuromonas sp. AOP6 TaxID=1566351 RepID=UPI001282F37F|nr:chemotaxis protein CheD [Desulfuromonas sp. AOP6]BCA80672.1 putative chemoreceptor glutamine deamidase CheD2 [Desulfuromonas sp. AOP6]